MSGIAHPSSPLISATQPVPTPRAESATTPKVVYSAAVKTPSTITSRDLVFSSLKVSRPRFCKE